MVEVVCCVWAEGSAQKQNLPFSDRSGTYCGYVQAPCLIELEKKGEKNLDRAKIQNTEFFMMLMKRMKQDERKAADGLGTLFELLYSAYSSFLDFW